MADKQRKIELLAPAGNWERFVTAIQFGADAVYLGTTAFSLRNLADNFTLEQVAEAVRYAHERSVKVYVTVNAFMRDEDLENLPETIAALDAAGADALIINDPSVIRIAKRVAPNLPLHLSTQANTLNSEAALFWHEQGIERIVLARELTLSQIAQMRRKLPETLELEAFVHGARATPEDVFSAIISTGATATAANAFSPAAGHMKSANAATTANISPLLRTGKGVLFLIHAICAWRSI